MNTAKVINSLDEVRRDALVGYLLGHAIPSDPALASEVVDPERLYEYLLLDVNVSSSVMTTRLLEATGSVQLYINRAVEGIEAVRFADKHQLLAQWETDKEYRLWEANKKLGYYPSQYVDPTLLRDASPQFYAFADAIKQGKLSDKLVRRALTPYLTEVSNQARSTIGGLCQLPVAGDGDAIDVYVTARMPGEGITWLLRKVRITRSGGVQSAPWEKITASLGKHVHCVPTPIYFEGAVHLVWLEESREADASGKKTSFISVRRSRRIAREDWSDVEVIGVRLEYTDANTARPYSDRIQIPGELTEAPLILSQRLDVDRWALFADLHPAGDASTPKPYLFIWIDTNNAAAQYSRGTPAREGFRPPSSLSGGYRASPHLMGRARYVSQVVKTVPGSRNFEASLEFSRYQGGNAEHWPDDQDVSCVSYAFKLKKSDRNIVFKKIEIKQGEDRKEVAFSSTLPVDTYNGPFSYDTFFVARVTVEVDGREEYFDAVVDCPPVESSYTAGMVCRSGNRSLLDTYFSAAIGTTEETKVALPSAARPQATRSWHFRPGDNCVADDGGSPFVFMHQPSDGLAVRYVTGPSVRFPSAISVYAMEQRMIATLAPGIQSANHSVSLWSKSGGDLVQVLLSRSPDLRVSRALSGFGGGIGVGLLDSPKQIGLDAPPPAFAANKWHHIVHTLSADGTQNLYVDGKLAASGESFKSDAAFTELILGGMGPVDVAGLQLFDRVLSAQDVQNLYEPWELSWYFVDDFAASDGTSAFTGAQPGFVHTGPSPEIFTAIHFDGTTAPIVATPAFGIPTTEYALALWFRTELKGAIEIAGVYAVGGTEPDLAIGLQKDGVATSQVRTASGSELLMSSDSPVYCPDGKWHHVVQTFGASIGGHRLYLDGVLAKSGPATTGAGDAQVQLRLGRGGATPFLGDVAGLKLFNHALSAEEVQALAQRPSSVAVRLYSETTARLREHAQNVFLYDSPAYRDMQALPEREAHDFVSAFSKVFHPFDVNPAEVFSFDGYDGCYGWELFFYMPWLVARSFLVSGDFDNARRWLHYIFDPTLDSVNQADFWICRPLREAPQSSASLTDPDAVARAQPIHYQDAIIHQYFDVLIAAGDTLYRNPTHETLRRAKMYYVSAKHLLGDKPNLLRVDDWRTPTLGAADDSHFKMPMNEEALRYWDRVDERLHNIRHGLSIEGKPLHLPLLQPPIDAALLQRAALGGGISRLASTASGALVPAYRFTTMLETGRGFVALLTSLGGSLQRTLEQQDAETLALLQQRHQMELINLSKAIQQEQVEMELHSLAALQVSRAAAMQRQAYFHRLLQENISDIEQAVMDMSTTAGAMRLGSNVAFTIASALDCVPNIYGLAVGGAQWGSVPRAIGQGLLLGADVVQLTAERLAVTEQYRRRSEEWQMQHDQALADQTNLDALIAANQRRIAQAQKTVKQQEVMSEQAFAIQHFMQQRFSNQALFQWMAGRLSTLYRQAYEATVSLCRQIEAACQYELGDFGLHFVNDGSAWDERFRGLLAGESLSVDLQRMELAYRQRNQRRHEITKTISLKALNAGSIDALKAKGKSQFSLTESLFDADYPAHYLRQIRSIAVTFPALLGPYQNVGAMLTQLSNTLYLAPEKNDDNAIVNLRAHQQVALSQGLNDAGLFQLDFNDSRYLPFEGTGVHSTWELDFPGFADTAENPARLLLASLNDVIVQVRYTAKG